MNQSRRAVLISGLAGIFGVSLAAAITEESETERLGEIVVECINVSILVPPNFSTKWVLFNDLVVHSHRHPYGDPKYWWRFDSKGREITFNFPLAVLRSIGRNHLAISRFDYPDDYYRDGGPWRKVPDLSRCSPAKRMKLPPLHVEA